MCLIVETLDLKRVSNLPTKLNDQKRIGQKGISRFDLGNGLAEPNFLVGTITLGRWQYMMSCVPCTHQEIKDVLLWSSKAFLGVSTNKYGFILTSSKVNRMCGEMLCVDCQVNIVVMNDTIKLELHIGFYIRYMGLKATLVFEKLQASKMKVPFQSANLPFWKLIHLASHPGTRNPLLYCCCSNSFFSSLVSSSGCL
jgi:hypothetical protein